MREFAKPTVAISKCIEFEPVRWNGQKIASDFVNKLEQFVNFIPVCPEVEIGLGVPRVPLRIVLVDGELRLVQPATGFDFSDKMKAFDTSFLDSLDGVDGFILKSGSPSCAFKDAKIYPKIGESTPVGKTSGFFARAVLERFSHLAIEDERRLVNARIREHFLRRLFAFASLRKVEKTGSTKQLVKFHSDNKLLLTAYSQKELKILGRIVAHQQNESFAVMMKKYKRQLFAALRHPPRTGSYVNVMMKSMGYFSKSLTKEEKALFLSSLERCRAGKASLSVSMGVMKSWIVRFRQRYLRDQTFFEPYPEDLADIDGTDKIASEKDCRKGS
jgi:uncharacterized protein YbgA (DUF1722 family)/uncharacterized protein YbbK (DUF523 family)